MMTMMTYWVRISVNTSRMMTLTETMGQSGKIWEPLKRIAPLPHQNSLIHLCRQCDSKRSKRGSK